MDENKLGTKVEDINELSGDIIHGNTFLVGEPIDEPFEPSPLEENIQDKVKNLEVKENVEKPDFSLIPNQEAPSQLKKFRELFGIKGIDVHYYSITRKGVTMTFGLRLLNYEDFQWVIEKAAKILSLQLEQLGFSLTTSNSFAYRQALIAMSICTLDEGIRSTENPGTPIWKIFGIEPKDPVYVKDPNFPHVLVRFAAADIMLEELKNTFYDTVNDLFKEVQDLINNSDDIEEGEEDPLA